MAVHCHTRVSNIVADKQFLSEKPFSDQKLPL